MRLMKVQNGVIQQRRISNAHSDLRILLVQGFMYYIRTSINSVQSKPEVGCSLCLVCCLWMEEERRWRANWMGSWVRFLQKMPCGAISQWSSWWFWGRDRTLTARLPSLRAWLQTSPTSVHLEVKEISLLFDTSCLSRTSEFIFTFIVTKAWR